MVRLVPGVLRIFTRRKVVSRALDYYLRLPAMARLPITLAYLFWAFF